MQRLVRARASDAADLSRIHAAAFAGAGAAWTLADFRCPASLVIADAAIEAGLIVLRIAADEAEILTLGVVPAARRQGIGRALIAAAEGEARRAGAVRLFLEVAADNPAAQALYGGTGFSRIGIRPSYYKRPEGMSADAIVMEKVLHGEPVPPVAS